MNPQTHGIEAGQGRAVFSEHPRAAFSLLEMLLALAILGGSLGILSQIAMTGTDAAREAEHLAQARLIAQSQLAVMLASDQTPTVVPPTPVEAIDSGSTSAFEYQVDVTAAPLTGMLALRVTVRALNPNGDTPLATYSLTRWLIDPLAVESE